MLAGIAKALLGAVWSVLGSLFGVKQAEVLARGQMAGEALRTAGVEAQAREETSRAYVAAGWWWLSAPFFLIAMSSAVYYVAVVVDTLATGFFGPNSWVVETMPAPFNSTVNQIILVTGGVSGGIGALGMILGRR